MTFRKSGSWKKQLKDKGFYIALAVCMLAVGVVAVVSVIRALPPKAEEPTAPDGPEVTTRATTLPPTTSTQAVENPVTNVPDLRTTAAPTTVPTTAAPTEVQPADLYVLPLSNEVCRPFSADQPLFSKTMGDWRTHEGVDFTGKEGQAVRAAADGTVRRIENDVMWGDLIEIDHGFGIVSRYCGVAARNVQVGDPVKVGQEIGVLGVVPCESEDPTHLHLEVLTSGRPLDAVAVIGVEVRYTEEAEPDEE